jgi:hypothetical protein
VSLSDLSAYVIGLLGVVALIAVFRDAINRPSPGDADAFTRTDDRCIRTRLRQEDARRRMKRLGHQSLLEGKPAWQRINPMAVHDEPKKILTLRRKP